MNLFPWELTDGYKLSHAEMYADGTEIVYSNLTPRSVHYYMKDATRFFDGKIVVAGIQGMLFEFREAFERFFSAPREMIVAAITDFYADYTDDAEHNMISRWVELYDLGKLPLWVATLPEGTKVRPKTPIMTVNNTLPQFFWLVNYFESYFSSMVWKTCTNATIAAEYKAIAKHFAEKTGVDDFTVSIQMHDFSVRGMSGVEDAARSGLGHLMSFVGSDNLPSVSYVRRYYGSTGKVAMGVPATEHAVATNNILYVAQERGLSLQEAEQEFLRDLITRKFPTGIVSYVSDSFDYWTLVTQTLPALKDVIMSRQGDGPAPDRIVIRPDTGNPVDVICGTIRHFPTQQAALQALDVEHVEEARWCCGDGSMGEDVYRTKVFIEETASYFTVSTEVWYNRHDKRYYYVEDYDTTITPCEVTPQEKGTVQCLWETFGGTVNEKGYKVLDTHIGLIYGDSITRKRALEIFERLEQMGFASGNVVLGIGSYTYQSNTRDTCGFAVKATYTEVNGVPVNIYKDPLGFETKKSAKGLLAVVEQDGELVLIDEAKAEDLSRSLLKPKMVGGKMIAIESLDEIRHRLANN